VWFYDDKKFAPEFKASLLLIHKTSLLRALESFIVRFQMAFVGNTTILY
jgi:hypothetical protein